MSNDILTNADKIEQKIAALETHRDSLQDASEKKASALSEYEKAVAITSLKVKEGLIEEFEGIKLPAKVSDTFLRMIIKGLNYKKLYKMSEAESAYKALVTTIDAIRAELNGLQSINRHLQ